METDHPGIVDLMCPLKFSLVPPIDLYITAILEGVDCQEPVTAAGGGGD